MELGFIGLGKMGLPIVEHLREQDVRVVAYNRSTAPREKARTAGAETPDSVEQLVAALKPPRTIWIMVTAGKPVDLVLGELLPHLSPGDIVIDGGNSNYHDSVRRYKRCREQNINFLDSGTSGGLSGARHGACLTIGGDQTVFSKVEPLLQKIAAPEGYMYVGSTGAGHYVKTIHNGIEYAMLQAYGEGFDIIHNGPYTVDLKKLAQTWNHGGVIRSWLLELLEKALAEDPKLEKISGKVGGGETGQWTTAEADRLHVDADAIKLALKKRLESQRKETFTSKVINALRLQFGGHTQAADAERRASQT